MRDVNYARTLSAPRGPAWPRTAEGDGKLVTGGLDLNPASAKREATKRAGSAPAPRGA